MRIFSFCHPVFCFDQARYIRHSAIPYFSLGKFVTATTCFNLAGLRRFGIFSRLTFSRVSVTHLRSHVCYIFNSCLFLVPSASLISGICIPWSARVDSDEDNSFERAI